MEVYREALCIFRPSLSQSGLIPCGAVLLQGAYLQQPVVGSGNRPRRARRGAVKILGNGILPSGWQVKHGGALGP